MVIKGIIMKDIIVEMGNLVQGSWRAIWKWKV